MGYYFFSNINNNILTKKDEYEISPAEGLGTFINSCSLGGSILTLGPHQQDTIVGIIFFILTILLITLYYVLRQRDSKETEELTNQYYFGFSLGLLFLILFYNYVFSKQKAWVFKEQRQPGNINSNIPDSEGSG